MPRVPLSSSLSLFPVFLFRHSTFPLLFFLSLLTPPLPMIHSTTVNASLLFYISLSISITSIHFWGDLLSHPTSMIEGTLFLAALFFLSMCTFSSLEESCHFPSYSIFLCVFQRRRKEQRKRDVCSCINCLPDHSRKWSVNTYIL